MLPPEAIREFKEIYRKEEGVLLSDCEAEERANQLFDLFLDLTDTKRISNNET